MSRLTFRDAQHDVAWQRQLRDRYISEGVPDVSHLDISKAIIRPVSRKIAEQIILKYEWLGTMVRSKWHYGIFFGMHCAGVCCVGTHLTGGINSAKEFHLEQSQLALLARGANVHWSPQGANSKLVSWTCKLLAKDTPCKLVIAYSDTDAGEIGTIYQACNWVYIGRGQNSVKQLVAPNGHIYDQKVVWQTRYKHNQLDTITWSQQRDALLDAGWREQEINPKHRYVWVLDKKDKALVELVESKRQPYPKRANG